MDSRILAFWLDSLKREDHFLKPGRRWKMIKWVVKKQELRVFVCVCVCVCVCVKLTTHLPRLKRFKMSGSILSFPLCALDGARRGAVG